MAVVVLDACPLIVLALAQKESGILATTDHGEMDSISATSQIQFLWLR